MNDAINFSLDWQEMGNEEGFSLGELLNQHKGRVEGYALHFPDGSSCHLENGAMVITNGPEEEKMP